MVTKVCQSLSHHLHSAVNIGAFLTICWQLWGTKNFMNKANLWFYFCYCTGNNKAMPKAWAVFVSAALTSSISPEDFYLKHSHSQTIKTRGGQGHIICLVLQWRLWLWWMLMNVSWSELWRMGYWPHSKWLKRKLPSFSSFALSHVLQSTDKCSCDLLWVRTCLCLKKVAFLTRLFFLPAMGMVQWNSSQES